MRKRDYIRCKFCGIHTEDSVDTFGKPIDGNGFCPRCRSAIYKVLTAAPSLTPEIEQFVKEQAIYNILHNGFVPKAVKEHFNMQGAKKSVDYSVRHWTAKEMKENKTDIKTIKNP